MSKQQVIEYLTDLECNLIDNGEEQWVGTIEEVISLVKEYGDD